ncbi:MAG: DUF4348 domain-containing protein [Prevotella sp.]|nr:DUF4348 domain-containing protein [Prevotella sp.]
MKKCASGVVLGCLLAVVNIGCSDRKTAGGEPSAAADSVSVDTLEQDITEMPRGADELFDDFIFNFAVSRKLQQERISFPLLVKTNGRESHVQQNQWKTEHFFMDQDYYTMIFDTHEEMELMKDTSVSHVVIEKIYLDKKTVRQYVFNRIGGRWMMQEISENPIEQNTNASFLQFYQHFASDEAFQIQSMNTTVEFTSPNPDDDFSNQTGEILPEQWPSFKPALIPQGFIYNIIYGQQYKDSDEKIFVIHGIANGFASEMTFRKIRGSWKLVKFNS